MIPDFNAVEGRCSSCITWTAGTALVMWLGELITQRGIGNGMSILIFASVVSRLPCPGLGDSARRAQVPVRVDHRSSASAMIVGIVFVESGQRRIPVQFAKRVVGRRMYGGQSTYIPLKVNQSGVIPVIFASSILAFPALIASGRRRGTACRTWINDNLRSKHDSWSYIALLHAADHLLRVLLHGDRVQPAQQADIIRKQGGFIPGIRPGPPTERYLAKVLNRITLPGSLFLDDHRARAVARVHALEHHASSRSAARRCSSPWVSRSRR